MLDSPGAPAAAPFVDAVLGLASVCRRLDGPALQARLIALVPADRPEMIAAVLGALSLRKTLDLVIAAICEEAASTSSPEPARWRRDVLR